jgi:hypothetical protein
MQVLGRQVNDQQDIVLFMDLHRLVKNYISKEKLMLESLRLGIDYRVLTQPTFSFLLQLKKSIKIDDLPWQTMQIQGNNQKITVTSQTDFF